MSCHVMCLTIFGDMQSRYDCEVSIFFMCDKSHFPASSGFITSMPTCFALNQLCIFKIVQLAEVWTHVNFLVSKAKGFHHEFNNIKVFFSIYSFKVKCFSPIR